MYRKFMLFILLLAVDATAQEREGNAGMIGRMDSVEIRVFREEELTTRGQLSGDGSISMPLVGSVRLAGMSTDQAAKVIEAKLRDGYLVKPEVRVSIESRIRRTVTILGQAQRPGVYEIPVHRPLSLVEAIGLAGGTTRIANDKKVTVKRGDKVFSVNLRDITRGGESDISLRDGDTVTIPESLF
jgi:protein involved in polysaccharide export with SLBB domain